MLELGLEGPMNSEAWMFDEDAMRRTDGRERDVVAGSGSGADAESEVPNHVETLNMRSEKLGRLLESSWPLEFVGVDRDMTREGSSVSRRSGERVRCMSLVGWR